LSFYKNDNTFVIVGYSFGSLLALKIAYKLETLGKIGKLILIDGSPLSTVRMTMNVVSSNFTEKDIQSAVIYNLAKRVFGNNAISIVKEVLAFDAWDARIDKFIEFGKDQSNYNPEFAKMSMTAFVNRIKMSVKVDPSTFPSLQSTTIELIKASITSVKDIGENYGLSQYSNKTINVQVMDGDHSTILSNPKLFHYLNSL